MAVARSARRGASLYEKISFQWKRGWNEIPEVMGGSVLGLIGAGLVLCSTYKLMTAENPTRQFKYDWAIMRPDHPDIKYLKRNDESPPFTSTKTTGSSSNKFC